LERKNRTDPEKAFWNMTADDLIHQLKTTSNGLSTAEADRRLAEFESRNITSKKKISTVMLLLRQFKNPLILILIFAAILSLFLHDRTDSLIILSIVLASGILGFWQERGAANAVEKLLAMIKTKTVVFRDGRKQEVPTEEIVPGDIIILTADSVVPGDCFLLESKNLYVNEAADIIIGFTLVIPFIPFGRIFSFVPIPLSFIAILLVIIALYILLTEILKKIFYKMTRL
jgi:Mg2+-importing ATPase